MLRPSRSQRHAWYLHRISDVAKLGKQHIRKPENVAEALRKDHPGRWLQFTQHKNRKKAPVHLVIPMLPMLERVLDASPRGSLTFIETEFGKPHTTKGLGNWFADQCVLADVPGRAHGLRKAGATIAAYRRSGFDAAKAIVDTDLGRDSMTAILADLMEITNAETARLNLRTTRAAQADQRVTLVFVAGSIVSIRAEAGGAELSGATLDP